MSTRVSNPQDARRSRAILVDSSRPGLRLNTVHIRAAESRQCPEEHRPVGLNVLKDGGQGGLDQSSVVVRADGGFVGVAEDLAAARAEALGCIQDGSTQRVRRRGAGQSGVVIESRQRTEAAPDAA